MSNSTADLIVPISAEAAYLAKVYYSVTVSIWFLSLIPLGTRIYVRVWPQWRFGWDDALIVLGFILATIDWGLLVDEMYLTPQLITVEAASHGVELAFLAIFVWSMSMTCIKAAVALTFLRIPQGSWWWKPFLYAIVGVQCSYFVGNTVYLFTMCRPIASYWSLSLADTAECLPEHSQTIASNVGSAINITTDVLLSLAPIHLLWHLRRPLRERILASILMGLGLLASASSIAKVVVVQQWDQDGADLWALAMIIGMLTIVEPLLAVMAASGPCLKGPIQQLLGAFGIMLTRYDQRMSLPTIRRTAGGAGAGQTAAAAGDAPQPHEHLGDSVEKTTSSTSQSCSNSDWSGQTHGDEVMGVESPTSGRTAAGDDIV